MRFFLKLKMITTSLKKEFPAEILKKKKFVLIVAFFQLKKFAAAVIIKKSLNAAYFSLKFDRAGNLK